MTITYVFLLAAVIATVVAALGKCPLWVATMFLCVVVALQVWPR